MMRMRKRLASLVRNWLPIPLGFRILLHGWLYPEDEQE